MIIEVPAFLALCIEDLEDRTMPALLCKPEPSVFGPLLMGAVRRGACQVESCCGCSILSLVIEKE